MIYYNHFIGHCSVFCGLKYILARSDHQSEARTFSYQPIRKLETIQMSVLFSLSVLFTSLASLELFCLCRKMANEEPNSHSSQLEGEDFNKLEEAVSENNDCSSSMQSGEVNVCLSSMSKMRSSVQEIEGPGGKRA